MVEFADFNHGPMETPMTETTLPLIELLQKQDDGDFLRAVAEAVLQLLMEHDVEGLVGAGRYERGDGRQTWRNGYRDRELKTRLGALNLRVPKLRQGLRRQRREALAHVRHPGRQPHPRAARGRDHADRPRSSRASASGS